MKKISVLIAAALFISILLMASAPGNDWANDNPGGKPGPKEINNGEPSMEKVYFTNYVDLKYGSSNDVTWSKPQNENKAKYFIYNNSVYYWYELPYSTSRVPEVGLCRWTYLYDLDHEW